MGVDGQHGLLVNSQSHADEPRARRMDQVRDVAIVGAGPAGLMAAERLATAGHGVSVYEADALAGA